MGKRDPLTTKVVACQWRHTPNRWRLWVRGRREVFGEAETFAKAQEALIESIMAAAPDLDAILPVVPEFDPPITPDTSIQRFLVPELFEVSGAEAFELSGPTRSPDRLATHEWAEFESLFRDGICAYCQRGRGPRTDTPVRISYVAPRVDAGWVGAPFGVSIHLFSERFLALLSPGERERLDLRPIETPPDVRRKFFELRGRPEVHHVGVRAMDADGFECPECHYRSVEAVDPRVLEEGIGFSRFVCAQDLPSPLPTCFTVGWQSTLGLVMTRLRWDELRGQRSARGINSVPLGVVAESECDRLPRIRNRLHRCEICAEWPKPCTIDDKHQAFFDLPARMCSHRNFTWLAAAARAGYLRFSRQTLEPMALWDLVARHVRPVQTEFVSFRCPGCWRLGLIVLTRTELKLWWR